MFWNTSRGTQARPIVKLPYLIRSAPQTANTIPRENLYHKRISLREQHTQVAPIGLGRVYR